MTPLDLHIARLREAAPPRIVFLNGGAVAALECSCPMCLGSRMLAVPPSELAARQAWLVSCVLCGAVLLVRGSRVTPMLFEAMSPALDGIRVPIWSHELAEVGLETWLPVLHHHDAIRSWPLHRFAEALFWVRSAYEALGRQGPEAKAEVLALARSELGERHLIALSHPTPPLRFGRPESVCWRRVQFRGVEVDSQVAVETVSSETPPGVPLPPGRYWHASAAVRGRLLASLEQEAVDVVEMTARNNVSSVGEGQIYCYPAEGAVHYFRRLTDDEQVYLARPGERPSA